MRALTDDTARDFRPTNENDGERRGPFFATTYGGWRALLVLGAVALVIRVVTVVIGCLMTSRSPEAWAHIGDGISYTRYADVIAGVPTAFTAYDARVFPGLPAMMAVLVLVGIPSWMAGLIVGLVSGALIAPLAAVLLQSVRAGWVLAIFPPILLACGVGPTTEAPLLALCVLGFAIGMRPDAVAVVAAGLLLGLAGTVRPTACFAVAGLMAWLIFERRWGRAVVIGTIAMAVVMGAFLFVRHFQGDGLYGVRFYASNDAAYGGDLITWPFKSLIFTPFYERVSSAKLAYVWLHVVAVFAAVAVLGFRVFGRNERRLASHLEHRGQDIAMLVWLGGNTLFVLCIGDKWGLQAFPRFMLPAVPAMLWAFRGWLPRAAWKYAALGLLSFGIALWHLA